MGKKVIVAGVGMIPFTKPGASEEYNVMGEKAARAALTDSGIPYEQVKQAYVGSVYGDSTAGQCAVYGLGNTGIPIVNVNNNCSTGSTALYLARQAVEAGVVDCAIAIGFEQMTPGALGAVFTDRTQPMMRHMENVLGIQGLDPAAPVATQLFGGAGREYQEKYETKTETFAKIQEKARKHAAHNPYALFRDPLTVDEIMESKHMYGPLTRFQCCPPTCGAAAAVLVSEEFAKREGITPKVVISAQAMTTDTGEAFNTKSMMSVVGYEMSRDAAQAVYKTAGVEAKDVDVVELHDCFTANELITYEALQLIPEGNAEGWIWDGGNTYGGSAVTNPSGGLLSKGHPLGATGLAQCTELVWQLRGEAEDRQVKDANIALQHNIGLGGACVVTLYERA